MSTPRRVLLTVLIVAVAGVAAGGATWSAFSSATANGGNSFSSGTVAVADNDAGSALVPMSNAKPGDSVTRCIRVAYSGSLPASMRVYATTTGSLAAYLDVKVRRGTDPSPSFPSCTGFTADATTYVGGEAAGVIYNGSLSSFPTSAGAQSEPTAAAPATWTNGDAHSYEVTMTLRASAPGAAQGLSSNVTFTWEARAQ